MIPEVVLIGHHKIGPIPEGYWESWYYVSEKEFANQLRLLQGRGYVFLDLAAFLDGLDRPEGLPPKSVLITFDDAYQSLIRHALPILQEHRCPSVVFVPTHYVAGTNHFDHDVEPLEKICTWEELAVLERGGMAVQSHGIHHSAFSSLSPAEQEAEIVQSKREIEEHLRRPVEFFSFPYGDNSAQPATVAEILQRAGYRAACLYGGEPVPFTAENRYVLTRIAMGSDTDLAKELDKR